MVEKINDGVLKNEINHLKESILSIREKVNKNGEKIIDIEIEVATFRLVKKVVYGAVGFILLQSLGAAVATIVWAFSNA